MVYRTEAEAAKYVANEMVNKRTSRVSVQISDFPINIEDFTNTLFNLHPELIACIENLSLQSTCLGSWYELNFDVLYTEIMASSVAVLKQPNAVSDIMLRDVQLHRRFSIIAIPSSFEKYTNEIVSKKTEDPQFLNCFLKGTEVNIKRKPGNNYSVFQIKYFYSCSYLDYRLRVEQMDQAISEITQLSRTSGIEDWKKAFSVVKYCVDHWRYGTIKELPGVEFSSYGAIVKHTAVCMGISLAICAIFTELGIPCRYVRGIREDVGHAWNLVFLRGGWFFIDVTDAIVRGDPFYHWGLTTYMDRIITDEINVPLNCTCSKIFLRENGAE